MGILKNTTLKAVAKKHIKLLTDYMETYPVYDTNNEVDLYQTVKNYLTTFEAAAGDSLSIRVDAVPDWYNLFVAVVWQCVRVELSYDPTMGSDEDLELTEKVVSDELAKWKRKMQRNIKVYEKYFRIKETK